MKTSPEDEAMASTIINAIKYRLAPNCTPAELVAEQMCRATKIWAERQPKKWLLLFYIPGVDVRLQAGALFQNGGKRRGLRQ